VRRESDASGSAVGLSDEYPIVLYDGVCGLCTGSVRFIIRREAGSDIRFASLQSTVGRDLAGRYGLDASALDAMILIETGRAFEGSDAALRVARRLRGAWRLVAVLLALPKLLREPVYRWVARNRYRLFGRLDAEWRPDSAYEDRFL